MTVTTDTTPTVPATKFQFHRSDSGGYFTDHDGYDFALSKAPKRKWRLTIQRTATAGHASKTALTEDIHDTKQLAVAVAKAFAELTDHDKSDSGGKSRLSSAMNTVYGQSSVPKADVAAPVDVVAVAETPAADADESEPEAEVPALTVVTNDETEAESESAAPETAEPQFLEA